MNIRYPIYEGVYRILTFNLSPVPPNPVRDIKKEEYDRNSD